MEIDLPNIRISINMVAMIWFPRIAIVHESVFTFDSGIGTFAFRRVIITGTHPNMFCVLVEVELREIMFCVLF